MAHPLPRPPLAAQLPPEVRPAARLPGLSRPLHAVSVAPTVASGGPGSYSGPVAPASPVLPGRAPTSPGVVLRARHGGRPQARARHRNAAASASTWTTRAWLPGATEYPRGGAADVLETTGALRPLGLIAPPRWRDQAQRDSSCAAGDIHRRYSKQRGIRTHGRRGSGHPG